MAKINKHDKQQILQLLESGTIANVELAIQLIEGLRRQGIEIYKYIKKKVEHCKLLHDPYFYAANVCPVGRHKGVLLSEIPLIDLVLLYNNGVLGKAIALKYKSWKFWDDFHVKKALVHRNREILKAIREKTSPNLKWTKSRYLDEKHYKEFKLFQITYFCPKLVCTKRITIWRKHVISARHYIADRTDRNAAIVRVDDNKTYLYTPQKTATHNEIRNY